MNMIIYNLAFSPKIKLLDLSGNKSTNSDTAEALYKLLKISGAIETLILQNTGVSKHLTDDFFKALGENKTLVYLNLDETEFIPSKESGIAKAIAMNAYKNGSLEGVSFVNWLSNNISVNTFIDSLLISDKDHELWYGDKKLANEMTKEKLDKKMYFKLKFIDFGN